MVAANGDRLIGTFTLTATFTPMLSHTATIVGIFTGGTGRFADVSGTVTEIEQGTHVSGPDQNGTIFDTTESTYTGQVSYYGFEEC